MEQTTATADVACELELKGAAARKAARRLATTSAEAKNAALHNVADGLAARQDAIIAANAKDIANGKRAGLADYYLDRLLLTPERIRALADDVARRGGAAGPCGGNA